MNVSPLSQKEISSFAYGTSDSEARPKHWVAVLVQMNTEKKISEKLNKLGIENYLPIQTETHQWSDRRKKVERVIIPMVIFLRITKEEEIIVRDFSFIRKFVKNPGSKELATHIPDKQIQSLKYLLENSDTAVYFTKHLKIGDTVKIARGPLKGFKGKVFQVNDSTKIVAIRIDCLGYACVKITKEFL
mgnify:CR=1 FL=1